jgi:hypothetical protein
LTELELLENEELLFKSERTVKLENNSNQPEDIHEKIGQFWVYLTNMRFAFVPNSGIPILEEIENIDYYSLIEKKSAFGKNRIRVWIGLTRLDLISDRENLSEIFDNMSEHVKRKLRKGAVILSSLDEKSTGILEGVEKIAQQKHMTMGDLLRNENMTISWVSPKNEDDDTFLEDEWNWNMFDNGDGTVKVVLVPAIDLDKDAIVPSSHNLRFLFEPSLSESEQEKIKKALINSELRQEFRTIIVCFVDEYEGKGVINRKMKGKRMLVDITLSSPIICYSRNLEKEIWSLSDRYHKIICALLENQTENHYKIKFEDSEFAIDYVLKSHYKITKDSLC